MPKLGRPSSRDKRFYMIDEGSEVTRNAPFGTNYTPSLYTKIIGSKYKKFQNESQSPILNDYLDSYTDRSEPMSSSREHINRRPVLPPIYSETQRDCDLNELCNLLPTGGDLPLKPIQLKNYEQLSLLKLIKYEIRILPDFINKLKEIYLALAKIDVNLTGLCSFKEFVDSCYQNNVHLSWKLFRIVASQFVVTSRDDASFVHYEKIISFLGAVYRTLDEAERCVQATAVKKGQNLQNQIEKPVYYHDDNCRDVERDEKSIGDSFDVDDAKIIKQINDDVGFYPIPLQGIRMSFQRADGLHRGTLSYKQIWDIFHSEGLILRKDSFDKLMHRCKYKGGGQYSWQQLIEFLERIQPITTGLQIPSSKMPLDYIRTIPNPASSWPHAEAFEIHHDVSDRRLESRGNYSYQTHTNHDFSQQHAVPVPVTEEKNVSLNSTRSSGQNTARTAYNAPSEPWFNKYLKFVDSIYLKDVKSQGILPTRDVYEASCLLNDQLGLGLTSTEIISAIEGAAVDNDRIYTNINSYLKRLAIR